MDILMITLECTSLLAVYLKNREENKVFLDKIPWKQSDCSEIHETVWVVRTT